MKPVLLWMFLGVACAGMATASQEVAPTVNGKKSGEWLMRINDAARHLNYTGIFVYVQGDRVESMQVTHLAKGDVMRQRIYSLNGAPREVIRDAKQVWCYAPDKKLGVHEYRQVSEQGFPNLLPRGLDRLAKYYKVRMGKSGRIADRGAQEILVVPRDEYRYGYDLWADRKTGLLLKAVLLDGRNRPIEQYLFTDVEIGTYIPPEDLEAVTPKKDLVWYGDAQSGDAGSETGEMPALNWVIEHVPAGFMLTRKIKRLSPMRNKMLEHYVYSDGLAAVSVFVEKIQDESSARLNGVNRMGAAHAFGREINGHQITVVGEVPSKTVDLIGRSVRPKESNEQ